MRRHLPCKGVNSAQMENDALATSNDDPSSHSGAGVLLCIYENRCATTSQMLRAFAERAQVPEPTFVQPMCVYRADVT